MSKLLTNQLYRKMMEETFFPSVVLLSNRSNVTNNNSSNINGKQKFER